MSVQNIKADFLAKRNQLVLLSQSGFLQDSCDSLMPLKNLKGQSIFEIFDFFTGLEAEVQNLRAGDSPFLIPMLEFEFDGKKHCLSMEFIAREDEAGLFLLLSADDDFSLRLRKMQQERNESVILLERIKDQEIALMEYTHRLETVNNSLDKFAYIVSHDLKSPLRAIGNLATWIEEGLKEGDHSEIDTHLNLLKNRVARMENLIEGILLYSRAGRVAAVPEVVDVSKMLQELAATCFLEGKYELQLAKNIPATLQTQKVALYQVFSNLFSNVQKYGNQAFPRIEVKFSEVGEFYQFGVLDNGPGIDARFHSKVFEIFQTLQSRDQYESTGIGLTIVKKIVEELGGRVWLESEVGSGAAFWFTWPKAESSF